MRARDAALLILVAAALLFALDGGSGTALLHLLPGLVLALPLLARRYPGERRLAARLRAPVARVPRATSTRCPQRPEAVRLVRGGLLIASSLSRRPPPAGALVRS
jgi:hypothetical protein